MANAFWLARRPRSTIRDFVANADLKIVDAGEHELVTHDHSGSVQQLEQVLPTADDCHAEGKPAAPAVV